MGYLLRTQNGGFTLVELLISMAIFAVMLASVLSFSITQRKYFSAEEQISEMIQNTRAAMDMISGEISVAGYSPEGSVFEGISYDPSDPPKLRIKADLNGKDGPIDSNEDITYSYDSTNKLIRRNTGSGGQPLIENVQNFSFECLDAKGNPTTLTADIRQIRLTITLRSSKPDPKYSSHSGYRIFTLTSLVTPRNLAY